MSGIFGYFDQNFNENSMNSFLHSIKGADYCITDQIFNHPCLLGRLGISNSEVKKSTTIDEDGISIVCCGEIYNEGIDNLEIEILRLYKEGQLHLVANFNGSFAAAIYNSKEEKVTLVNDRYGLIKLFYFYDKDHFCFSPKMKPLLTICLDKNLRNDSIVDFFTFGYILGDKTFFKEIHQLPSGSILEYSKNQLKITKYWRYEYDENYDSRSIDELISELGDLWQKAVKRRIQKNDTILIPLSGGLDSRAILAEALQTTSKENIITFTFGHPGSFDFEIGKIIAKKAGVKNIELGVEKESFESQYNISIEDIEGIIDATPYIALRGYKDMKKYGKNIISGYMGGEIMGSHISPEMLDKKLKSELNYVDTKNIIYNKHSIYNPRDIKLLFNQSCIVVEDLEQSFETTIKDLLISKNYDMANFCSLWDYTQRQNKYIMLTLFRYRGSFKILTPFLDNDLVDFMLKIPPELRFNKYLYVSMLLKKYPKLFEIPTKNSFGLRLNSHKKLKFFKTVVLFSKTKMNNISSILIKKNIFLDKTKNYINYDDFLRRNLEYNCYIRSMICKVEERKYFNSEFIENIWKLHMSGKKNYSMLFGLLVTFELFCELYVDN